MFFALLCSDSLSSRSVRVFSAMSSTLASLSPVSGGREWLSSSSVVLVLEWSCLI